jgi:hypothetical protein
MVFGVSLIYFKGKSVDILFQISEGKSHFFKVSLRRSDHLGYGREMKKQEK